METTVPNVDIAEKTATTPTLRRSVQDQAIENYIRDAERLLTTARLDQGISERLYSYGFDDEELARGMGLQDMAWQAFCAAHPGERPSQQSGDLAAITGRTLEAREEFADFRLVARAAFQNLADRVTLRVVGDPPDDLQRFVTAAYAGYDAAEKAPYAEKLSKRGFAKAKLDALRRDLDVLATVDAATEIAGINEEEAPDTGDRDAAYNELKEYMKELKGVARAAFRKNPDALDKLGL